MMSEVWIAAENGWYIKSPGYMKVEPDYQKVSHKKAADSIERGNVIVFAHINQGREVDIRTYVPKSDAALLGVVNSMLRELVQDMWFWGYCGHMDSESQEWQMSHIDGVLNRMRKLGVEVPS